MSRVVVFDYGSGNVRSAVRALEHVGADVELTGDRSAALGADGLFVPGVGNFHACMAGLRAGFVAARPDLIQRMEPFRNNVISIVTVRAVLAALDLGADLIEERRAKIDHTRTELCAWLTERRINFIPPQANFIVIETGQDAREMQAKMIAKGFAIGRRFDTLEKMTRVTIGTDAEMAKFRQAFSEALTS